MGTVKGLTPIIKVLWANRKAEIAIVIAVIALVDEIIKALPK